MNVLHFIHDLFASGSDAEFFDTDQPWVCWRFLSTDARTRITGRMVVLMDCCVCGQTTTIRAPIPRFGPTGIGGGKHPDRIRFLLDHLHPDKGHPMSWAKPLRNPAAHQGLNLDLLAMRLQADLREALDDRH